MREMACPSIREAESWFGWLRITHVLELLWWFGGYVSLQGRCRLVAQLLWSSVRGLSGVKWVVSSNYNTGEDCGLTWSLGLVWFNLSWTLPSHLEQEQFWSETESKVLFNKFEELIKCSPSIKRCRPLLKNIRYHSQCKITRGTQWNGGKTQGFLKTFF